MDNIFNHPPAPGEGFGGFMQPDGRIFFWDKDNPSNAREIPGFDKKQLEMIGLTLNSANNFEGKNISQLSWIHSFEHFGTPGPWPEDPGAPKAGWTKGKRLSFPVFEIGYPSIPNSLHDTVMQLKEQLIEEREARKRLMDKMDEYIGLRLQESGEVPMFLKYPGSVKGKEGAIHFGFYDGYHILCWVSAGEWWGRFSMRANAEKIIHPDYLIWFEKMK